MTASPGTVDARDHSALPDPNLHPPVVAESGDPFAALRIVHLLARLPIGPQIPVRDVVARLNSEHTGWVFSERVVLDAIAQLRANWIADFRTQEGIDVRDGDAGRVITLEDAPRTARWLRDQAWRFEAACQVVLDEFARGEGRATEG